MNKAVWNVLCSLLTLGKQECKTSPQHSRKHLNPLIVSKKATCWRSSGPADVSRMKRSRTAIPRERRQHRAWPKAFSTDHGLLEMTNWHWDWFREEGRWMGAGGRERKKGRVNDRIGKKGCCVSPDRWLQSIETISGFSFTSAAVIAAVAAPMGNRWML